MLGNPRLDHLMIIYEKFNPDKIIFKLRYNSIGAIFTIQILNTSKYITYKKIKVIGNINKTQAYLFNNDVIRSKLATNKYKLRNNKFLSYVNQISNGPKKSPNVRKLASALFYSICTKSPEAQRLEWRQMINPDNTLEGVFDRLGRTLFVYKGYSDYNYAGEPVIGFVWLHSNFESIMQLGSTIELDSSFAVLKPSVYCIPQLIYRNTGFPLALIVGLTESSDLYSLFFESLKKI